MVTIPSPVPDVDVAIVGAGPVGLALAALLDRAGVTNCVFERRDHLHRQPQAHVINTRTMEILREIGIARAVVEAAAPPLRMRAITWCESLAGRELGRIRLQGGDSGALVQRLAASPTSICNLAQNRLEPLLLARVRHGARSQVRFGSDVASVEDRDDHVVLAVRGTDGTPSRTSARWVAACDGAGSRIRRNAGIEMAGPASLQKFVSIYFEADLDRWIGERSGPLFWIAGARTRGVIIGFDLVRTWALMVSYDDAHSPDEFSTEVAERLVADAIGDPKASFSITSIGNWNMSAQVAECYRSGRIFLVGDAAHRFPPTGGLGMNTGIQDAHNLAWKLAAVVRGTADAALLDTYELERRGVAQVNCEQSLRNAMRLVEIDIVLGVPTLMAVDPGAIARDEAVRVDYGMDGDSEAAVTKRRAVQQVIEAQAEHFDFGGLDLGLRYEAGAVVGDGTEPPPFDVQTYTPAARPGSRLPHVWVEGAAGRVSTLDVATPGRFTLITGDHGDAWVAAARALVHEARLDLDVAVIGGADADYLDSSGAWADVSGIDTSGAVLVRPDGHVAWRSATQPPGDDCGFALDELRRVFHHLLGRGHAAT